MNIYKCAHVLLAASFYCFAAASFAQEATAPKMPSISAADMAQAQKESAGMVNSAALDMAGAKKTSKDVVQQAGQAIKLDNPNLPNLMFSMPKVDKKVLRQRDQNDYARLTSQFYTGMAKQQTKDDFVVLVSLSMPKESLKQLADQSARYGAVMVFRGLKDNNLKAMMTELKSIIGDNKKVNIQINPVVFTKLSVQQVPTFAIIQGNSVSKEDMAACAPPSSYMAIAGDVPMEYALEKLAKASSPEFAKIAEERLTQGSASK